MKDIYNERWVVRVKEPLGMSSIVYRANNFPRARDESLRRNAAEGATNKFFVVPEEEDEGWIK